MNLFGIKRFLAAVLSFSAAIFLSLQPVIACSWDYPIWQVRHKNAEPLYRFIKGDKAGYIDRTGKIVVEPTLDFYSSNSGGEFFDGLLLTGVADGAYIDKTGKIVLDTKLDRNWDFSDGLAAAMEEGSDKWGYIDKTGKFAISPRFATYPNGYVYPFSDNLAMIEVKDKYGYIDRTGEFVIAPRFLKGESFSEGFARVVVEGPCVWIGDGPCAPFNTETVGEVVKDRQAPMCKFAFIDKSGAFLTNDRYVRAGDFSEGMAAVIVSGKWSPFEAEGKWGFIDTKGKLVINPQFDAVDAFSDGLTAVKIRKKWGFINKQCEIVIEPQFDRVGNFSDGLAPVGVWNEKARKYEEHFYIDKTGKQAFPGRFSQASHYFKGVAHVKLIEPNAGKRDYYDGKYAYLDAQGKTIFIYERGSDKD